MLCLSPFLFISYRNGTLKPELGSLEMVGIWSRHLSSISHILICYFQIHNSVNQSNNLNFADSYFSPSWSNNLFICSIYMHSLPSASHLTTILILRAFTSWIVFQEDRERLSLNFIVCNDFSFNWHLGIHHKNTYNCPGL